MFFTYHVKIQASFDKNRTKRLKEMREIAIKAEYKIRMHKISTNMTDLSDRKKEDKEQVKAIKEMCEDVEIQKQNIADALNYKSLCGEIPEYTCDNNVHYLFRIIAGVRANWTVEHEEMLDQMQNHEKVLVAKMNKQITEVINMGKMFVRRIETEQNRCESKEVKKFVEEVRKRQTYKRMMEQHHQDLRADFSSIASRYGLKEKL